ncbi:hypothetical protein Phi19:2_gp096 [Cellulophaga phage phi19:2]|uniref:Uncharacterized protein n=2 Tax=Cellulophaga phage phiST TaxID=756282 RepID=M4SL62_9CAUD|nr:hypothetical protein CGPG_00014 [Cellulophaga phage phiST]AGH56713.1 hypothetical protein CGPG_00014 [Cellulophaga phage phiST]AGO47235.1 hypothetical protein PhiST_gp096 [Cellulophaga phage phiST]AGO48731.1 hypothetical protein Phi19:2_gp096 [Cellulophaga phage phi19:2]
MSRGVAESTLQYWRDNLSCEAQVKRQLADEYANAESQENIEILDEIWDLVYNNVGESN